jgi:hypothetical protein
MYRKYTYIVGKRKKKLYKLNLEAGTHNKRDSSLMSLIFAFPTMYVIFWERLNSDGQQFHQYQQNEQSPIMSTIWTKIPQNMCLYWYVEGVSLLRQPVIPTAHYSDDPLFRQPIFSTTHYSDSPLLRQWQISTLILWYF